MGTLTRIGLVVAIPLLMVCALVTPQLDRSSRVEPLVDTQMTPVLEPDVVGEEKSSPEVPLDLYGNEVIDAVAKYKFDATGSLYETHSPQTELPRLTSPKS